MNGRLEIIAAELAAELRSARQELELALKILANLEQQALEESWYENE